MLDSEALLYLDDYVKQHDPVSFLRRYLDYIQKGMNLGLPKQTGEQGRQEWQAFIVQFSTASTPEFIQALGTIWDRVVGAVDASGGPMPASQLIRQYVNHLDNKPLDFPVLPEDQLSPGYIIPEETLSETVKNNVVLPETTISALHQVSQQMDALGVDEASFLTAIKKSLSNKQEQQTILWLLRRRTNASSCRLPVSSGIGKIKKEWQDIANKDYNVSISGKFLERLTSEWYRLILRYHVPITDEDYHQLLVKYVSDNNIEI